MPIQSDYSAPPHVWFHAVCALIAIIIGAYLLSRQKGTMSHRALGRVWVVLMLSTSIGSFFIQSSGTFSSIHILSVVSIVAVASAVYGARNKNLELHRMSMIGAYCGLVIAGAFTLLPQRLLGKIVFG